MIKKLKLANLILYMLLTLGVTSALSEPVESATNSNSTITSYLLGPGDVLNISVWKEEGMQQEVLVKPDGSITFPLAGEINAGGMTTIELTDELVRKLERYIPSPIVTVSVLKSVSNKVYVLGKVNRPGEFIATSFMDVLQALSLAGGLTPYADSDDIKIFRRTGDNKQSFDFDYDEVISGDNLDMNIILKAGDTVVVP